MVNIQKSQITVNPQRAQFGQQPPNKSLINSSTTHPMTTTISITSTTTNTFPSIVSADSTYDITRDLRPAIEQHGMIEDAEYTDELLSVFDVGSNAVQSNPDNNHRHESIQRQEQTKLAILIQTRQLEDKMNSFMTLMDEKQLTLNEQHQVYESIRNDYENIV